MKTKETASLVRCKQRGIGPLEIENRYFLTQPDSKATIALENLDATYQEWLRDGPDDATATATAIRSREMVRIPASSHNR